MIIDKIWKAIRAQLNKFANFFSSQDPIAQMQYEYDAAVEQLREGRKGLEQYRALVERVSSQVADNRKQVATLEARVKAFLQAGDRDTAAKFALEMQKAKNQLAENESQVKMHEEAYNNSLLKIQHATGKIASLKDKIHKYDADLKLSRAEAEVAELAHTFNFDVTTDFGQVEDKIKDQINLNKAKVRVASDLSGQGLEQIKQEQQLDKALADQALRDFEQQLGMVTPDTAGVKAASKELGPAAKVKETAN